MNAAFFGLAFTATLNPKLLSADLLIIENRRPRAMFICFLASGLGMSLTIGIGTHPLPGPPASRGRPWSGSGDRVLPAVGAGRYAARGALALGRGPYQGRRYQRQLPQFGMANGTPWVPARKALVAWTRAS